MSLKGYGQLCIEGQILVVATLFCCKSPIVASKHSVGRLGMMMCLTFEETTKKKPCKSTSSCKTINGTKSLITQNIPESVRN